MGIFLSIWYLDRITICSQTHGRFGLIHSRESISATTGRKSNQPTCHQNHHNDTYLSDPSNLRRRRCTLGIDTKKLDVHEILNDESYYEMDDYDKLIALLRHILPIGQKYKIWQADDDPSEALELIQDQMTAAIDENRKALLKRERNELLTEIRSSLQEYQRAVP